MYDNSPSNFNDVNSNVALGSSSNGGSKGLVIGVVVCAICALAGLGLGIFNSVQMAQLNQTVSGVYVDDDLDGDVEEETACVLPRNANEIDYLLVGYNKGGNLMFVDSENEVVFYTSETDTNGNRSSTEQVVKVDTAAIMQQAFSEGLSEYSETSDDAYDENDELVWSYVVELGTKEGYVCQAGGTGDSPIWFNSLVEAINDKR